MICLLQRETMNLVLPAGGDMTTCRIRVAGMLHVEKPRQPSTDLLDEGTLVADLETLARQHAGHDRELRSAVANG